MTQQGPLNLLGGSTVVNSITATAPLTANGVSGSAETGSVTIAISGSGFVDSVSGTSNVITAIPTTGNVVVDIASTYVGQTSLTTLGTITTGTWHGGVVAGQYGGTGVANTGLTINLGSATTGYVLTSDSSGNATWQATGSTGVTSIAGTANQIVASASTGSVTLSFPATGGLAIGTNQATTPPVGGLSMPGNLVIGGTSSNSPLRINNFVTGSRQMVDIDGFNQPSSGDCVSVYIETQLIPASGSSGICKDLWIVPGVNAAVTVPNFYGIAVDAGTGFGTITNAYGVFITTPGFGTVSCALYADNASIGYKASPLPTNGLMVSGHTLIGTSTDDGTHNLQVNGSIKSATIQLTTGATNNYILTSDASGNATWEAITASGAITTIDGDSGSVTPSSGVVTISGGTTGLTTSGSSATLTLTGTLKLANGGTNASLTASNGGIFYSTASAGAILAGTATALQMLQSGASTTPAWSTTTWPATTSINTILYSSSASVIGQITAANNGVLISGTGGIPSWLAAGTTGQVLIATTSNPASWGTLSGIAVTSIAGTANQIVASASTGAVTLSLANGVSIGSYQATPPPVGGLILPGQVLIGTSAVPFSGPFCEILAPSGYAYDLLLYGSLTINDPSSQQLCLSVNNTFAPGTGVSPGKSCSIYTFSYFNPVSGSTITNAAGIYCDAGSQGGSGTVTNGYGGYFVNPNYGTNKCALHADNASIGTYTGSSTPPSGGLIVSGQTGIGTNSVSANTRLTVAAVSTDFYVEQMTGTMTAVDGSGEQFGLLCSANFEPTSGASGVCAGIYSNPLFVAPSGDSIAYAFGMYSLPEYYANAGTITNAVGLWVGTLQNIGTGSCTYASGASIFTPTLAASSNNYGVVISGSDSAGASSGCRQMLQFSGSVTGDDGGNSYAILINPLMQPTTTHRNTLGIYSAPYLEPYSTNIVDSHVAIYALADGTVASGTITNAYSGRFITPNVGTNKVALYADNLSVGVLASGASTAGTIRTAPPASSSASLTLGTAYQNTTGYDVMLTAYIVVGTSGTACTLAIGVDSSSSPTQQNMFTTATIAQNQAIPINVYLPNNYYVKISFTGTLLVASITGTILTPV